MSIRKLRAGRVPGVTASQYVGVQGTVFWDEPTGQLRLSDGATPGGKVLNPAVTASSTIPPLNPYEGELWYNPTSKELWAYHDGAFAGTINQATNTVLGGVRLGPGVTTNELGQIIIDPEGLEFSFGDFSSTVGTKSDNVTTYAVLSSIHPNEDIVIASNGTGDVSIVGEFTVHATNGALNDTLESEPAFHIKADGQVKILVPGIDSVEGAVSIVGSSTGAFIQPGNTGVMLHVTGQYTTPSIPSRIYNDAQGSFAAFVARRFNGTVASPTAVLADEEIMRISGTAHDGTVIPGAGNTRIIYKALGNQTLTNHGGTIELWTTPLNSTTLAKVVTINNADGITSTKFTGPLTGNVTGNADTVTNGVVTTGSYSDPSWLTISKSKVGLSAVENTALSTWAGSSNITTVGTLTNLTIATGGTITTPRIVINDGGIRTVNAGSALTIDFATDSIILWTAPGLNSAITLTNYTAGARVKVILAITTTRDIAFGVAAVGNSSTGATAWNGTGAGSIDVANTAMHLDYTCISALAAGCYVAVTAL